MAEEIMEALEEDTTPNAEPTSETAEAENSEAVPQADEGNAERSDDTPVAENDKENSNEDFLTVTYMHEQKIFNRDEAVKYVQMGVNYERFEPLISKLDYLAAVNGVTREEFIEKQLTSYEEAVRQDIIARFGEDEDTVKEMLDYTKQKHQKAYDAMLAKQKQDEETAKETTETRLAEEFTRLCKEFPELTEKGFKGLPQSVKQAGFKGENLLNAYLYYKHSENKKIATARQSEAEAEKKTTGPMGGDSNENLTEDEKNFLKGLWGK